ncbi:MAG TPA: M28 family peptidase [bacterium]|nr:M28 family peptidase [bacterium]
MDARLNPPSAERLMRDVRMIAQWERLSGSPGERQAFEYIQRELRAAKIATTLLEHPALISLPGRASFRLLPADEELTCITHSFAAPARNLEAAVVYLDESTPPTADAVAGCIVATDGLAMPGRVAQLQRARAAAAVFLNRDPHVHEMIVSTVWGSPTPERLGELPAIPVVSMAGPSARRLRHFLEGSARVGDLRARLSAEVETAWRPLPLLVADLPGEREDTFVLLAGHVDSWYVGAMDNGGANAAMMEIARLLARARRYRGLRVAFWSGHSHGRYAGSAWYADTHWAELDERCAAHLYVDSIGGRGASLLTHGYCMPETRAVGAAAIKKIAGQAYTGSRVGRSGDQSFLGIGIPSLFMTLSEHPKDGPEASRDFAITGSDTGGLGWWWHTPEDTPDKLDPVLLARDTAIYFEAVRTLCGEPVLPLDYAATAAELLGQLRDLQERLGERFDLGPCLAEARGFERAARALRSKLRKIGVGRWRHVARANQALMRIGRALIPVLYTQAGRFDHDPATTLPSLPPLAGADELARTPPDTPEAYALTVGLTRGRNRLVEGLRAARQAAEEAMD